MYSDTQMRRIINEYLYDIGIIIQLIYDNSVNVNLKAQLILLRIEKSSQLNEIKLFSLKRIIVVGLKINKILHTTCHVIFLQYV